MAINQIAWSVAPGSTGLNRPRRLVADLTVLGGVLADATYKHHGRAASTSVSENVGTLMPKLLLDASSDTAVLSPVFRFSGRPKWIDYYDDWSLAPDINPIARMRASSNYRKVRGLVDNGQTIVTVNSPYMAMKLMLPLSSVIPNGVDSYLADTPHEGDDRERVLVLGKLFPGRTDEKLVQQICKLPWIREVVFCGVGNHKRTLDLIARVKNDVGDRVKVHSWVEPRELGKLCGKRTFALVPHIVNDYTISQNLMKAYMLTALGVPVVCPAMLWPHDLPVEDAFLINAGIDVDTNLRQWNKRPRLTLDYRRDFAIKNSWAARAALIAERVV